MGIKIKLSKDFERLKKAFSGCAEGVRNMMPKGINASAEAAEEIIKNEIMTGNYDPNAPLTIALKNHSKPLIGQHGGETLLQSITIKPIDKKTAFVGILDNNPDYEVAFAVHEGATIGITEKTRGLFYVLWLREKDDKITLSGKAKELWNQMPGGWRPLNKSTTAIDIPGRPFISNALKTDELMKVVRGFWTISMIDVIRRASR